jgi:hypothetical protein
MSYERTTSSLAVSSLKFGLLSLPFAVFAGVPAVVQGVRALREIHGSAGRLKGRLLAWTGIGTGLCGIVLPVYLLMLGVERVRDAADRSH